MVLLMPSVLELLHVLYLTRAVEGPPEFCAVYGKNMCPSAICAALRAGLKSSVAPLCWIFNWDDGLVQQT